MRHDDSNNNPTQQAEKFDEMTGGYDDVDHARAAKRLNADLRAMDATPRVGHTPGPWRIDNRRIMDVPPKTRVGQVICEVEGASVGHTIRAEPDHLACPSVEKWNAQRDENARLIAAAPDLLEALQALAPAADAMLCALNERGIENDKAKRGCAAIAKAYAAIARATR